MTEVGALSAAGWAWSARGRHATVTSGRGRCTTGCTILVILNGNSKTDTHLTDFNEAMTMVSVNKWSK